MECVVGIDIGTTSTIGILIALPDRVLAQSAKSVTLLTPKAGWAEEDPTQWWANTCAIIPDLIAQAGIQADQIKGVGVTGMLPALIILDEDDQVLRNSIQQSDGRCGQEVLEIAEEITEDDFIRIAGNGINQQLIAAKLRWLERHEPDVFGRIATVFGSYDYINWKLTGVKAVEQNWALEAGFVDLPRGTLSDALIRLAHIDPSVVPGKVVSHAVLGHVSAKAAAETGLTEHTPVVGGGADHIASGFAAGITMPGDVLLKYGGSTDILVATNTACPDRRMFLDYHLIPGLFMPNGCMASGGTALNWFVEKIAGGEADKAARAGLTVHQHLDKISQSIPAGSDGVQVIPYFLGEKTPINDPRARGTIHGLSLNHDLRHIWRAMLEGFAYAFRHHVDVFQDMGCPTERYIASDGGATSRLWVQISADVIQRPIQLLIGHPGSCLGAAWLAAIGCGLTNEWAGVSAFISYGNVVQPEKDAAELYDRGYQRFRQTYQAMAKIDV